MKTEITLPLVELKQALPGLGKLVSKSRHAPVLQMVRLHRDAKGMVTLESTDLNAHVAYQFVEPQHPSPLEVLVPYEALNKLIKSKDEALTVIPDGKEHAKLRYNIGGSLIEQRLSCPETKEWPATPKLTTPPIALAPHFGATLRDALQCAGADTNRPVLQGACLDVSDKQSHYVVGTDGRILFAANSFAFGLKQSVIVPHSKFLVWPGFDTESGGQLVVQQDPKQTSWVQLRTARWTYTARQIEGNYPNWKQVLPTVTAKGTTLQLSIAAVQQILTVLAQLPGGDDQNKQVRLFVTRNQMHLGGRAKNEPTWTRVPISEVTITGPALEAGMNRELLAQALRYGLHQIYLESPDGVALFSEGGRKCVVKLLTPPEQTVSTVPVPNKPSPQPTEAAAAASPSAATTEPNPTVPTAMTHNTNPTMTRRGPIAPVTETKPPVAASALATATLQLETVKTALRDVLLDLNATLDLLKAAEKEKKTSAKEVESVRATLRSLQKVAI